MFWRSVDRRAPHNLYTSTALIREVMSKQKLENKSAPQYFKFNDNFTDLGGKLTKAIAIGYDKNYTVGYEYSAADKLFYRTINGVRLKDKESGKDIATTNIIIEEVVTNIVDDKLRLDVQNIGNNRGYYLTGGQLIEIQWYKSGRRDKTVYKDLKGNEIQLNKGTTWIQVVPSTVHIEIK